MKQREARRKIFVPARMRVCAGRDDVRILDISSRGLLVQSSKVPDRGTYIELSRGPNSVTARVVWTGTQRFGVRTREPISIDRFINGDPIPHHAFEPTPIEMHARRSAAVAIGFDRSRERARSLEFACVSGIAAIFALLLGAMLYDAIARPMQLIAAALR